MIEGIQTEIKQASRFDGGTSNPGAAEIEGRVALAPASNAEIDRRLASLYQQLVTLAESKARLAGAEPSAKAA